MGGALVERDVYGYVSGEYLSTIHRNGALWRTYAYDGAGRTTQIWEAGLGTRTFAWNGDSRLTSITGAGGTRSYAYDGLGARVSAADSLGTRTFLRAGVGVSAPVLSDGQARYTPGVSERRGGATTYLHSGLKNAGAQTGAAQTLSGTRHYDAFGREWPGSSSGTWQGPFAYAGAFGYQTEPDSGLKLLGHRYYDPETGRFLTRDPIKDGSNWYAYAHCDPLRYVDPDGRIAWVAIIVAAIVIIDIIDTANDVKDIIENPSDPTPYIGIAIGAIDPTPGNIGKRVAKPSLSAVKAALKEAHDEVGKISGSGSVSGKFGAPQRVDGKRGYRLDPPHPNAPAGSAEEGWHNNWWDWTEGKRGRGGRSGAIPIE